jgi:hypothetical protein
MLQYIPADTTVLRLNTHIDPKHQGVSNSTPKAAYLNGVVLPRPVQTRFHPHRFPTLVLSSSVCSFEQDGIDGSGLHPTVTNHWRCGGARRSHELYPSLGEARYVSQHPSPGVKLVPKERLRISAYRLARERPSLDA